MKADILLLLFVSISVLAHLTQQRYLPFNIDMLVVVAFL